MKKFILTIAMTVAGLCTMAQSGTGCDSIVEQVRPVRCEYDSVLLGTGSSTVRRYSFHIENGDTVVRRYSGSSSNPTVTVTDMDHVYYYNPSTQCTIYYHYTLNIIQPEIRANYDTVTACDSYSYPRYNNVVLTQSVDTMFETLHRPAKASYIGSIPHSQSNCYNRNDYLTLTINRSDTLDGTEAVEACGSWYANGIGYVYTDGQYTVMTGDTTPEGCNMYKNVQLTLHQHDTLPGTDSVVGCKLFYKEDYSTYRGGSNVVLLQSGDYTLWTRYIDSNGCELMKNLHVQIVDMDTVPGVDTVVACREYRYPRNYFDGYITIPQSGHYIAQIDSTDENGCHLYKELELTIVAPDTLPQTDTVVVCNQAISLYDDYQFYDGSYIVPTDSNCTVKKIHVVRNLGELPGGIYDTVCESYSYYNYSLGRTVNITDFAYSNISIAETEEIDTNGCHKQIRLLIRPEYDLTQIVNVQESFVWNGNTYTQSGIYDWTGSSRFGCDSTVHLYLTVGDTPIAGIAEVSGEANMINVYPNPTDGKLHIEAEGINSVEVYDLYGRTVQTAIRDNIVDLTPMPNGIYILRVTHSNGVSIRQVIKK